MIKRCNKKGSHVAVVVSFVIFITFIMFLYALTRGSFNEKEEEDSLIEYLKTKLIEETSASLRTVTVSVVGSGGACIDLNGLATQFGIDSRVIVKNQNQITTPAVKSGDNLRINRLSSGDDFFKIYNSAQFPDAGTISASCTPLSENTGYVLGIVKNERYVFEKKVFELMYAYENYEILKENLKIPESNEFGLGFIYQNKTLVEVGAKDVTTNVYVREVPVQYISREGDIKTGFLRIMIW